MYVLSSGLINYWNNNKTALSIKRAFIESLGLDPGEHKFTEYYAYIWEDKETPCTIVSWDEFTKLINRFIIITFKDYVNWVTDKNTKNKNKKKNL